VDQTGARKPAPSPRGHARLDAIDVVLGRDDLTMTDRVVYALLTLRAEGQSLPGLVTATPEWIGHLLKISARTAQRSLAHLRGGGLIAHREGSVYMVDVPERLDQRPTVLPADPQGRLFPDTPAATIVTPKMTPSVSSDDSRDDRNDAKNDATGTIPMGERGGETPRARSFLFLSFQEMEKPTEEEVVAEWASLRPTCRAIREALDVTPDRRDHSLFVRVAWLARHAINRQWVDFALEKTAEKGLPSKDRVKYFLCVLAYQLYERETSERPTTAAKRSAARSEFGKLLDCIPVPEGTMPRPQVGRHDPAVDDGDGGCKPLSESTAEDRDEARRVIADIRAGLAKLKTDGHNEKGGG